MEPLKDLVFSVLHFSKFQMLFFTCTLFTFKTSIYYLLNYVLTRVPFPAILCLYSFIYLPIYHLSSNNFLRFCHLLGLVGSVIGSMVYKTNEIFPSLHSTYQRTQRRLTTVCIIIPSKSYIIHHISLPNLGTLSFSSLA